MNSLALRAYTLHQYNVSLSSRCTFLAVRNSVPSPHEERVGRGKGRGVWPIVPSSPYPLLPRGGEGELSRMCLASRLSSSFVAAFVATFVETGWCRQSFRQSFRQRSYPIADH